MVKKISFLFILLVIFLPLLSLAQNFPTGNFLEIKMSPENPEPNQMVKVTINSYSYDLDRLPITWLVNGGIRKTELGLKEFTVSAGKGGQTTTVTARVEIPNDTAKERSISFTPASVDLIYEFLSYTPPFYKGKTLNPNQGVVLINAIPELINSVGTKISPQNIIFAWKKNGKVDQAASGLGKNVYIYSGTIPIRDTTIEVNTSSLDNKVSATKKVIIKNNDPKIIFYEDNPLYGLMFNRAISGTVRLFADEFKVKAFPYFMSVGYTQNPDLNYKWSINGRSSPNLENDKTAMVFRQEGPGSGSASVSLKIENTLRIFQFAENNFVINFEKQ